MSETVNPTAIAHLSTRVFDIRASFVSQQPPPASLDVLVKTADLSRHCNNIAMNSMSHGPDMCLGFDSLALLQVWIVGGSVEAPVVFKKHGVVVGTSSCRY